MRRELPALTDPELYVSGDPHRALREMRQQCPVAWHERDGEDGFWAVTSWEWATEVLNDWERFTSTGGTLLRPDLSQDFPGSGRMLVLTDPPRHHVLRRAVMAPFTRRAIEGLESRGREIVQGLLARALSAGKCDFVADVAAKVPFAIGADLLSVMPDHVDMVAAATTTAAGAVSDVSGVDSQEAHLELLNYYAGLLGGPVSDSSQDLLSSLRSAQRGGLDITDEEILLTCDNVVVAAGETTRNAIASGLLALIEHPEQWAHLRGSDAASKRAVEEIIRWAAPVTHVMRTATADTMLGGVPLRKGDAAAVWPHAVNRDEAAIEDGDAFRLDRHPNRHYSFGVGVHFCLGAALARLIIRVVFEEVARSGIEIRLNGQPERLRSYHINGLRSLPVSLRRG